ncbi:MAG: GAF domain-containing protein [Thermoflexales bacterium]|nr:GAF domain-containing protein [Thermoflexales bacterium]
MYKKALLVIGVMLIAMIGGMYVISRVILLDAFVELEEQDLSQSVGQVLGALSQEISDLDMLAGDWAAWDDSYAFIEDGREEYVESNLVDSTFANLQLNLVLYVHASGRFVYGKAFDLQAGREVTLPASLQDHLTPGNLLLRHVDPKGSVRGILLLSDGAMLVASRPIVTSEEQGPIRGTLIMGRYLNPAEIERLGQTMHVSLAVHRFDDPLLPADFRSARFSLLGDEPIVRSPDEQSLAAYAMLLDIYGQPGLIVRVDSPRLIYAQGVTAVRFFMVSIVMIGVVFSVVVGLFLERLTFHQQKQAESERLYQQRAAELEVLYSISLRLNASSKQVTELLHMIAEQAVALLGADVGALYVYDPQRDELAVSVAVGYLAKYIGMLIKPGEGLAGRAFQDRRPMTLGAYAEWPDHVSIYQGETGLKAILSVPLLGTSSVLGVLDVGGGEHKHDFDPHDVRLAELFAAQAAIALENARLHAETQRRARELAAINVAARAVASALDLDEVLGQATVEAQKLLGVQVASVLLHDTVTGELVFSAVTGPGADKVKGMRLPASKGVAGWVLRERQPVMIQDTDDDPRFYDGVDALMGFATRSLLAVPLLFQQEMLGVLEALNKVEGDFEERDLEMLGTLASSLAVAISNARQYQSVQRRLRESEAMAAIQQALNESLDLEQTLRLVATGARVVIPGVDQAVVYLIDEKERSLRPQVVVGEEEHDRPCPVLHPGEGFAEAVITQGAVVNIGDVRTDTRYGWAKVEDDGLRSFLAAPVQSGPRRYGLISLQSGHPHAFSTEDERLLTTLGVQAAFAIDSARLKEAEQRAREVAEALRAVTLAFTQTLDLNTILEALLDYLELLVPYDSASIMLWMEADRRVVVVAARGYERWIGSRPARFIAFDDSAYPHIHELIANYQSVLVSDTQDYPAWVHHIEGVQVRTWLGVPLMVGGALIGLYSVDSLDPGRFTREHRQLAESLAAQVATAVRNAQLYEQVQTDRQQLRRLTHQVVAAQEVERGRISRELHDEAGQALTALKISLGLVQAELPPKATPVRHRLAEAISLTDTTMEHIRLLAQNLHPPSLDAAGLSFSLEALCRNFDQRTGLVVDYSGTSLPALPESVTISFYRFLQEALTNVAKHAAASHVEVALSYAADTVSLLVEDNGRGFDTLVRSLSQVPGQLRGIGLLGMQERLELLGGRLEVESEPGQGTRLVAHVPWKGVP